VVEAASAAVRSGANIISIADTTGCMIPGTDRSMYDYVKRLRDALASSGLEPWIAVHCHNDRGLAVANALDAYRAGVDIIGVTLDDDDMITDLVQSVKQVGKRGRCVDLSEFEAIVECCRAKQNHMSSRAPTQGKVKIPTCAPLRL
jgi:isopropylmalate/homocitrate/citramalate synthase